MKTDAQLSIGPEQHGRWPTPVVRHLGLAGLLCASACTSFEFAGRHVVGSSAKDMGRVIPDDNPDGIVSVVRVEQDCEIVSIEIDVEVRHPWSTEIGIDLASPSGTSVRVKEPDTERDGGLDIVGTYPGSLEPFGDLRDFIFESGVGPWTLTVSDRDDEDVGTLESWSVQLGCED